MFWIATAWVPMVGDMVSLLVGILPIAAGTPDGVVTGHRGDRAPRNGG